MSYTDSTGFVRNSGAIVVCKKCKDEILINEEYPLEIIKVICDDCNIKPQTKKGSIIETMLNVGSGYFLAMALNLYFLPHFATEIAPQSIVTAAMIGLVYTITSMIRSFTFRRMFNKLTGKRKWL